MTQRNKIRKAIKARLIESGLFRAVYTDRWKAVSEGLAPFARIEINDESAEWVSDQQLSRRTAHVDVIIYAVDDYDDQQGCEDLVCAVDNLLALDGDLGCDLDSFSLTNLSFDSDEINDQELCMATMSFDAVYYWRPDPPKAGPFDIVHVDIDMAVGDPPGPDGQIDASTEIDFRKLS